MTRTLACQTPEKIGQTVQLNGWINSRRNHGGIVFIDLRDRTGLVQVVCQPEQVEQLRDEYVVEITGEVKERPKKMVNPDLVTGEVEVKAEEITVLAKSETPPFDIHGSGLEINEKKRLQYRYLDLRRPRMAQNIRQRSKAVHVPCFAQDTHGRAGVVQVAHEKRRLIGRYQPLQRLRGPPRLLDARR